MAQHDKDKKAYDHPGGEEILRASSIPEEKIASLREEGKAIVEDADSFIVLGVIEKDGKVHLAQSAYAPHYKNLMSNFLLYHTKLLIEGIQNDLDALLDEKYPERIEMRKMIGETKQ